jgi:predicted phage-related endonuclease
MSKPVITVEKIDNLAILNAQIKTLQEQADAIKAEILASGCDQIVGTLHKVTVVHSIRTSLDSKKVKEIAPAVWEACSVTQPVHAVRILAR